MSGKITFQHVESIQRFSLADELALFEKYGTDDRRRIIDLFQVLARAGEDVLAGGPDAIAAALKALSSMGYRHEKLGDGPVPVRVVGLEDPFTETELVNFGRIIAHTPSRLGERALVMRAVYGCGWEEIAADLEITTNKALRQARSCAEVLTRGYIGAVFTGCGQTDKELPRVTFGLYGDRDKRIERDVERFLEHEEGCESCASVRTQLSRVMSLMAAVLAPRDLTEGQKRELSFGRSLGLKVYEQRMAAACEIPQEQVDVSGNGAQEGELLAGSQLLEDDELLEDGLLEAELLLEAGETFEVEPLLDGEEPAAEVGRDGAHEFEDDDLGAAASAQEVPSTREQDLVESSGAGVAAIRAERPTIEEEPEQRAAAEPVGGRFADVVDPGSAPAPDAGAFEDDVLEDETDAALEELALYDELEFFEELVPAPIERAASEPIGSDEFPAGEVYDWSKEEGALLADQQAEAQQVQTEQQAEPEQQAAPEQQAEPEEDALGVAAAIAVSEVETVPLFSDEYQPAVGDVVEDAPKAEAKEPQSTESEAAPLAGEPQDDAPQGDVPGDAPGAGSGEEGEAESRAKLEDALAEVRIYEQRPEEDDHEDPMVYPRGVVAIPALRAVSVAPPEAQGFVPPEKFGPLLSDRAGAEVDELDEDARDLRRKGGLLLAAAAVLLISGALAIDGVLPNAPEQNLAQTPKSASGQVKHHNKPKKAKKKVKKAKKKVKKTQAAPQATYNFEPVYAPRPAEVAPAPSPASPAPDSGAASDGSAEFLPEARG